MLIRARTHLCLSTAIRLPFTFEGLASPGRDVAVPCSPAVKSSLARRATDPAIQPRPDYANAPDAPVYVNVPWDKANLCNTYVPGNSSAAMTRLLWTVQYLVASGFYVVVGG